MMEEENNMNKSYLILSAFFLGLLVTAGAAQALEKGPAELVLRSTVDPASKPKPAFFPHAIHQSNFECAKCHHSKGDDGKQVAYTEEMAIEKCETCHNKAAVATGMSQKLNTFKKAAHERCKVCHVERKKEGIKAGPTKCNGCHRKDLK